MELVLWKLLRQRALRAFPLTVAALSAPLYLACSCPPMKVVRSPESLVGVTIPIQLTADDCRQLCGEHVTKCERVPLMTKPVNYANETGDQGATVLCHVPRYCPGGRRPAGLAPSVAQLGGLGAHFAELARVEAASVHAFVELAAELELHGAPPALIEAAYRAALEEVDHAQRTAELARAFGAVPVVPDVAATPPRDLTSILADNAVEGLVHERYGAALAALRATRSTVPAVRDAMAVIARDEAGHADLAADLHAWGMPRVSRAARARIREAREQTLAELRDVVAVEPGHELGVLAGMPDATRAVALCAAIA